MRIPLSRPEITEDDIQAVAQVMRTLHLSLGPKIPEFEEKLAAYVGRRHGVAVSSGTAGLHLVVKALGLREGDEVITTPFSFIASANCLLFEKVRPVFADIDREGFNIDPVRIEERITKRTRAILPVHVFGRPCNMAAIRAMARNHNLLIIEDACEALGAQVNGRKAGSFGSCGVFAFYPNKQMTTGEGGMIVTDSKKIAETCRSLRNQGRNAAGRWLSHIRLGYNYRITDMQASLGITQLERLDEMLKRRDRVAQYYRNRLARVKGVSAPFLPTEGKMSWFVFVVLLDKEYGQRDRDRLIRLLSEKGIETSNYFPPIHLQPVYRKAFGYKKGDYPVTESVAQRTLALPFYNFLGEGEIDYVCECLERLLKTL